MLPVATADAPVTYELVWGTEENQRQTWVDNGEGTAFTAASRALLAAIKDGKQAGLYIDGKWNAGHDFFQDDTLKDAMAWAVQCAIWLNGVRFGTVTWRKNLDRLHGAALRVNRLRNAA